MAIQNLTLSDEVTASTSFAVSQNGEDVRVLPSSLKTYLDSLASTASGGIIQYSAPVTGFSLQITDGTADVWAVLTPAGTLATGTLLLPAAANATAGQEVIVNSTQIITSLTITCSGGSVVGAPTTIAANGYFKLKFEPVLKTWYRVS